MRAQSICIFCLSRRTLPITQPLSLARLQQRHLQSSTSASRPSNATAAAATAQKDFNDSEDQRGYQAQSQNYNQDEELSPEEIASRDKRRQAYKAQQEQGQVSPIRYSYGRSVPRVSETQQRRQPLVSVSVADRILDQWVDVGPRQERRPERQVQDMRRQQASNDAARGIFRPSSFSQTTNDGIGGSRVPRSGRTTHNGEYSTADSSRFDRAGTWRPAIFSRKPSLEDEWAAPKGPGGLKSGKTVSDQNEPNAALIDMFRNEPAERSNKEHTPPSRQEVTEPPVPQSSESRSGEITTDKPMWSSRSSGRHGDPSSRSNGQQDRTEGSAENNRRKDARKGNRQTGRGADEDIDDEVLSKIEEKRRRKAERQAKKSEREATPIALPEYISIGNLADALRVRPEDFSTKLRELGFEQTSNDHVIDAETAGLIVSEFNYEPILPTVAPEEDLVAQPVQDDESLLLNRPPVITIMGHVDHGKTTLLDYLRESSVAASEHGGITQHIGAFTVQMPGGRLITFLDTPGHSAFISMRARGANVTDIVILVVAADDSVKPQTIEAIKHAKAARVAIIVAINKMDKEGAEPERVKQDLGRHGVEVEDFGGDTQTVLVSGKTGQGMAELEDAAIALADVLDVRADVTGPVEGWVLEASRKAGGKVATVLVRRGTLEPGQILVAGTTWTRVRSLRNEAGGIVKSAGPGTPVEVDGWREQPLAGAEALQAPDEHKARRVVDMRALREESTRMADDVTAVNEFRRAAEERQAAAKSQANASRGEQFDLPPAEEESSGPKVIEVPFIIRGDVYGSVEAVTASIQALGNAEIRPLILKSEVGAPTESDLDMAATTAGNIIAFNVPVEGSILAQAERSAVRVVDGSIIYRVVDDIKAILSERLPPKISTRVTGEAEVVTEFEIGLGGKKKLKVAGCRVRNGVVAINSQVKLIRDGKQVFDGLLGTLKNQKKDVSEMRKGTECGLSFAGFEDFLPGDAIQCYETFEEKRTLL